MERHGLYREDLGFTVFQSCNPWGPCSLLQSSISRSSTSSAWIHLLFLWRENALGTLQVHIQRARPWVPLSGSTKMLESQCNQLLSDFCYVKRISGWAMHCCPGTEGMSDVWIEEKVCLECDCNPIILNYWNYTLWVIANWDNLAWSKLYQNGLW